MSYRPFSHYRLVFRVDGNTTIGLGHLVRCQALAQALQPVFESVFVWRNPMLGLSEQLVAAGLAVLPLPADVPLGLQEASWLANKLTINDILVIDGYQFTPSYQRVVSEKGIAVVCLDDLIIPPNWADVVLNQAGGVLAAAYNQVPLAQLYLGPAYALLRPPFWQRNQLAGLALPPRLFLNMGGADPTNQTMALLPQLHQQFAGHLIEVVTGAAYPYGAALQNLAAALGTRVRLQHNLPADKLAALLRICQVFVCPPSGVAYECCAAGGAVFLHPTADNQRALFDFLVKEKLALPLTDGLLLPEEALPTLAATQHARQQAIFDGHTTQRLQDIFVKLADGQRYQLRRAAAADAQLYFGWANDPTVRHNAIHSAPIDWATHLAWFTRRIQATDSYLYLMTSPTSEPVGQVRIEFAEATQPGIIDYSVAPTYRGQGLGRLLLRRALQRLRHDRPALAGQAVVGQVKIGNAASARVFEQLRFMRQTAVTLQGEAYDVFRLDFPAIT